MGGFKSNSRAWLASEANVLKQAEIAMAGVINSRASILAPVDTGALNSNGRVEKNPNGGQSVIYGDQDVPYARIHELGGKTGRGYKTNITAKHYLKQAGDSVAKENPKKYIDMGR